jgi:D-methionine transport system permease protein
MSFDSVLSWWEGHEGLLQLLLEALGETVAMVFASGFIGFAIGIPIGIVLHLSKKNGLLEHHLLNKILGIVVNIGRSIPFIARLVEGALLEVPSGLVEAAQAMGAKPQQIITKVLLPEALPGIINAVTITLVTLVGYSAMAGTVGGGGLGDVGIRYGYQRFDATVMMITVVILVFIVQLIQSMGDHLVKYVDHR